MAKICFALTLLITTLVYFPAHAELVGEVNTAFRLIGKDDRVVMEAYDDPKVQGVTCYVSRARTGGITDSIGLAEDEAEASIACRQVGDEIRFSEKLIRTN